MPERRLLRTQLLVWLMVPLFLLLATGTFIGYSSALSFSQRAYDQALTEIARDVSLHLRSRDGGIVVDLTDEARGMLFSDTVDRVYFEVATEDGRTVAGEPLPRPPLDPSERHPLRMLYDGEMRGEAVRVVEVNLDADPAAGRPAARVRVAETERKRTSLAREILLSVLVPQLLLVVIAGIVVWVGVVHGLAPLKRLRNAIAERSHLDRSPVAVPDVPGEVNPLVQSINDLLGRLDGVLTLQSRFVADAAHQLKTPIAALKAQYELAAREEDPERLREALQKMLPGLDRLSRLVSQLLTLARNDPEAVGALALAPLDVNALALDVATGWVPEAIRRGVDLGFDGSGRAVMIQGDAARLRELFDNLVDNAVRYSPQGGHVTVRVAGEPVPTVAVEDEGLAIPPDERERVFERFHRLLGSQVEGSGLGLAIAREIASLHDARITLGARANGVGNIFSVSFPPAPRA